MLSVVNKYVANATSRLGRQRYAQESAYVDAFLGRLDGIIDLGDGNGTIDLRATVVADRGQGAAEHKFGADFALVFDGIKEPIKINKAILGQAKGGCLEQLVRSEKLRLIEQCEKMAAATQHYLVLEAPSDNGAIPTVRIGTYKDQRWAEERIPFDEYLVDYVISCNHGDRRDQFIRAVGDSKLLTLQIVAEDVSLEPDPPSQKRFPKNKPSR